MEFPNLFFEYLCDRRLIEGPMLAHRASDEAVACVEFLAGKNAHVNYLAVPSVIYTSPEVASVGFTEAEAKKLGLELQTGKSYFRANGRARCGHEQEGFVKVIGDKNLDDCLVFTFSALLLLK